MSLCIVRHLLCDPGHILFRTLALCGLPALQVHV
jgi:hypothetical protein